MEPAPPALRRALDLLMPSSLGGLPSGGNTLRLRGHSGALAQASRLSPGRNSNPRNISAEPYGPADYGVTQDVPDNLKRRCVGWRNCELARCTAPVRGHRSASAAANCPVCGSRYGRSGGYRSYGTYSPSSPSPSAYSSRGGAAGPGARPRWSRPGSSVDYTPTEVLALTPVRDSVEDLATKRPDLRDVFLCHAWDDRHGAAKELHDLLEAGGVRVWFSEKDVGLGVPLLRAIDKGLANSRVGTLVTPALLSRLPAEASPTKSFRYFSHVSGSSRRAGDDVRRSPRRQPSPGLAKRPEHCRRFDGNCRSQARRTGHP